MYLLNFTDEQLKEHKRFKNQSKMFQASILELLNSRKTDGPNWRMTAIRYLIREGIAVIDETHNHINLS